MGVVKVVGQRLMATQKEKVRRGSVNCPDVPDLVDLPVVVSSKRHNIVEPDNENDVSRLLEINGFNESIVSVFRDN